ncbi:hypothetical protein G8759_31285 [Spirosoma aureum]|uniref:Uncharacterized protein n=1 Tax=Spirosoma aureum TaxID=2692134 RepID=A0A6G9AWT2_9BACT|nr:hypothetical protein [Spirosoma aureum]QIP16808.1 hypothetical protein G8759_31285 [Spirosoma aureum]
MAKAKPAPAYQVNGLSPQTPDGPIPIEFRGRTYDLLHLSPEELAFLLQYPDQVPYLIQETSQSNG